LVVVGVGSAKAIDVVYVQHEKNVKKDISINRDTIMSIPVTGGLKPNGGHRLMVNHSHSWLLPCGPGGMF
jgi:hypothetical protein